MIDPIKLHAYADGEATRDEIAEIEGRLPECDATRAELEAIRSFKACLAAHRHDTDHAKAWTACCGRLGEIDSARKTERFVSKFAWAFASGIVGLVVLTGVARRGATSPAIGSADLAQIMSQLGPSSRRNTANSDEQRFAAAMLRQSRLVLEDKRLNVVAMSEAMCDGMLVRRMTLRDGRGHLALLDLPSDARIEGLEPISGTNMRAGQLDELNCVVWPSGSRTLVLVGDREPSDLARTATLVHESR